MDDFFSLAKNFCNRTLRYYKRYLHGSSLILSTKNFGI